MRFAVELKKTGELVGFCGFDVNDGTLDFGWRYARKFWGGGIGGEAALAALELGRSRFGLKGIEARSFSENVGSVKIFHKLGMSFLRESEERGKHVVHYGYPHDDVKSTDLKWPDVKHKKT
jgi:RimJ/RimL family protein N-acetyltransferase